MRLTTPRLSEWIVAFAAGAGAAVFLWPVTPWAAPIALLSAAALLGVRQLPVTAAYLLAAVQLCYLKLQVPPENPAALAPGIVAVYALGRFSPAWARGAIAALVYLLAALTAIGYSVADVIFAGMLFGGSYAFGRVVRRRSETARVARAEASHLAAINVPGLTARVVADERARLGGRALEVIRRSVDAMRRDASSAMAELDPQLIQNVAERGRAAITELRWLLGLLRTQPNATEPQPHRPRRFWIADAALVLVLLTTTVLDGQIPEQPELTPLGWAMLLALPLTLLVRRIRPLEACLAAAVIVALTALAGAPLFAGTGAGALVTLCLLAWSSAVAGRPATWAGLAALAAVTAWPVLETAPENIPILFVLFALPAFAGHEWSARDRDGHIAQAHAATLQFEIDARVEFAVRAERLRIARDLHDVTSHAVGVMVLQASAALALRATDAAAARGALRTVEKAGATALQELAVMFDLLEAGAIGAPGLSGGPAESVDELVERMRAARMRIEFERVVDGIGVASGREHPQAGDAALETAEAAEAIYRVAQESLTNVARHAPRAAVQIRIALSNGTCEVVITDDGGGDGADDGASEHPGRTGAGFGLAGLAERVRGAGGQFTAGPAFGGGYEVRARVPWPGSRQSAPAAAEPLPQRAGGAS
ncbi:sensor histidine kinase [Glaciibacter sp. 2TAF33]|uniref:sensor histidine kinase n=1 Tax=Glaciibacter sp. 2TAF33 TaxID=3233015 RepID=UPI003F8E9765